jgi:hypothetical protein
MKNLQKLFLFCSIFLLSKSIFAQIGINSIGSAPATNAIGLPMAIKI